MRNLSKSKLIAYRQCPKRLWLEIHAPELREDSATAQMNFMIGYAVGDIAQQLYDPNENRQIIDAQAEGYPQAFARTQALLTANRPIFEAGFCAEGGMAFADVMLPNADGSWRMVEVKSSTSVKDYHKDDIAIQSYIAKNAGVNLSNVALAHIDSNWIYQGNHDYRGLLVERDLTALADEKATEVKQWIAGAQSTIALDSEPQIDAGVHCFSPYDCGFYNYCTQGAPQAEFPINWLPRASQKIKTWAQDNDEIEAANVPDELLNLKQQRVKDATIKQTPYFDKVATQAELKQYKLPIYFIDFETINFAVPIWSGTRPYQQIPFQFSAHKIHENGELTHQEFLDTTGADPMRGFAEKLIQACELSGAVFVYNAGFEKARIRELAERFPELRKPLLGINARIVDLLPIARNHYYHPRQQGSWSIKKILPAIAPELSYDDLEGVQHGGGAMEAYTEAIHPDTSAERRAQLHEQLLRYCELDTYAMIKIWQTFANVHHFKL